MSPRAHHSLGSLAPVAGFVASAIAVALAPASWTRALQDWLGQHASQPVAFFSFYVIVYGIPVLLSYLAFFAVVKLVPARCPRCGETLAFRVRPEGGWMNLYSIDFVCRACGAKTNVHVHDPDA